MAIGGSAALESRYGGGLGGLSLVALLPAIGTAVSGFLLVMGAQATRAIVDTADHAREIRAFLGRTS